MEIKNKKKTIRLVAAFFALLFLAVANETLADQGLLNNYSVGLESSAYAGGSLVGRGVGNLNYINVDSLANGASVSGRVRSLDFRGELYVPATGAYKFSKVTGAGGGRVDFKLRSATKRLIVTTNTGAYSSICSLPSCELRNWTYFPANSVNLTQGWYQVEGVFWVPSSEVNPPFRISWTRPGMAAEEVIPLANLSTDSSSDASEILIPSGAAAPDEQINFLVGGTPTIGDCSTCTLNPNPEIRFTLPSGITSAEILKSDVWVFWNNSDTSENSLQFRNINGVSGSVSGAERMETSHGYRLAMLRGKIPPALVEDDGAGNLSFRFINLDNSYEGGIGMVLVYKDISQPFGRLTIKTPGEEILRVASHAYAFETERGLPLSQAKPRPFFIFSGGQSKPQGVVRPNYLSMRKSSSPPDEESFFADSRVANKIVPEEAGNPSSGDNRWYPAYGRLGNEFDVLAMSGNYAGSNVEGVLDRGDFAGNVFDVSAGDDWVAFQAASSQMPEDGLSSADGIDSLDLMAIGMLAYSAAAPPLPLPTELFKICPTTVTTISQGSSTNLKAYYWSDYQGGVNPCDETAINQLNRFDVTYRNENNTGFGASWSSNNSSVVSIDLSVSPPEGKKVDGAGVGSANISAEYTTLLGNLKSDNITISVTGVCPINCSCVADTCSPQRCPDGCGGLCPPGTKDCSFNYVED